LLASEFNINMQETSNITAYTAVMPPAIATEEGGQQHANHIEPLAGTAMVRRRGMSLCWQQRAFAACCLHEPIHQQ
jgi:hypothetical protein